MDELATRLTAFADKYGSHLADTVLATVRFQGYADLVGGVVALVVAIASGWGLRKMYRAYVDDTTGSESLFELVILCLAAVCLFASLVALVQLLDPWTYAAIFSPDVYLVKKAIKL